MVANLGFLVMRWRLISRFQKIKQIVIIKLKIVLNIPRQFFAHTSRTVMLNMHVNFMSIRFLVADLGFRDEDWFRSLSYTNIIKYIPLRPNFSICYSEREDNNESGQPVLAGTAMRSLHGNGIADSQDSWYLRKLLVVVVTTSCISKHIRETLVAY